MAVLHDIFFVLWFFLPAAYANMAPILVAKLPLLRHWKTPIDGGRQFRSKPLFGPHKTWRGIVTGMVIATLVLWLQQQAVSNVAWIDEATRSVDYRKLPTLVLGPLFGLGALAGDAIESFFKRQRGIESGEHWIPFDQLDYIIGGMIVSLPFVILPLRQYFWLFVVWFGMHVLASYIGWLLKLKDKPI